MKKKIISIIQILVVSTIAYYIIFLSSFSTISSLKAVTEFFKMLVGLKLLTWAFIVSIYLFLLAVTNSKWISTSILMLFSFVFAFINHIKMSYRNEPFLPTDLDMVNSIPQLIQMITLKQIILIVLAVTFIFAISFLIFNKKKLTILSSKKSRVAAATISLILSFGFISISNSDSPVYKLSVKWNNDPFFWDSHWGAMRNGPLLTFVNFLNIKTMDKPEAYSRSAMEKISEKYEKKAQRENKKRQKIGSTDVVMILSESFSDPTRVPGVKLNEDPMPFTRSIMEKNPSGLMLSNGYGGGTANMEFQALTGLAYGNFSSSLTSLHMQLIPKMKSPFTVNNLFDQGIAIHPYSGNIYNRKKVLNKFSFSKFYNQDGPDYFPYQTKAQNNQYVEDSAVYKYVLEQIKSNNQSTFYHVITMQNHVPFTKNEYPKNKFKVKGGVAKKERDQIETYAKGVNLTDQANKEFINSLKNIKKNVVVMFYGDHLPGIYSNVDFDKEGILMHETPYFVWSNHTKLNKEAAPKLVGSYGLSNLTFDVANLKITPYYSLLSEVTNELPVISANVKGNDPLNVKHSQTQLVSDGKFVDEKKLTAKQKQILHEYLLVQYDLTAGKHYLSNKFVRK